MIETIGLPYDQTYQTPKKGEEELHQAAEAFEALFVGQLLKSARQTKLGDDLFGDKESEFTAMLDQHYAQIMADSSQLGIAEALVAQLKPHINESG